MKLLTWLIIILAAGAVLMLHDALMQRQYAYGAATCVPDRTRLAELDSLTNSLCFWYIKDGKRRCTPKVAVYTPQGARP